MKENRFLICSDGLTDMLSDEEIAQIMGAYSEVKDAVFYLLQAAMGRGGRDNTTIILCELRQKKPKSGIENFRRSGYL